MTKKACFISIEGIEGVGKSTVIDFLRQYLAQQAIPLTLTREPGGTPIAEAIRQVFLGHYDESMCADTELLLLFAGRMQNIHHIILPALQRGEWVLADRFIDASFAYQGGGRGVATAHLDALASWVPQGLQPDLTLLLDAPVAVGMQRIQSRGTKDRMEMEGVAFFERVRQAYLERAAQYPQRFRVIDATQDLTAVTRAVAAAVQDLVVDA